MTGKVPTTYAPVMAKSEQPTYPPIHPSFVVSLSEVPGYPTERSLGVVAGLGTSSGRTARNKGVDAYVDAMDQLRNNAAQMGANAIVGLTVSTFAASQGGSLGDAVGVLFMGTAAVIEVADS